MAKKTKRLSPAQHEMIVAWVLGGADAVGWHSTRTFYALVKAGYLDQGSPTQRARDYVDQWALGGTRKELEAAAERELFGDKKKKGNPMAKKKKMPDVTVEDQGTVVIFGLLTSRVREWFNENVYTEPWQWLSERRVAVEPRAADIVGPAMCDEGFRFG